jgi:hypothetical protein
MSRSRRARSRPAPAMATVRSGWRPEFLRRAAASMRTSMPLRGTRRLTLTMRGPDRARPRRVRALAFSIDASGTKRDVSTPGGTCTMGGIGPPSRFASDSG